MNIIAMILKMQAIVREILARGIWNYGITARSPKSSYISGCLTSDRMHPEASSVLPCLSI